MGIILFIVIILVLVVGHEAGHFLAAKLSGMRVPEFGVGFPPKLWGKKIGETEYTVNALPFGGFVRIHGEEEGATDPDSFSQKPVIAQALTLLAGPFMNFVLGFLLFALAFMVGVPAVEGQYPSEDLGHVSVTVTEILSGSPAEKAGLAVGDHIAAIETKDGHSIDPLTPKSLISAIAAADGPVTLEVIRGSGVSVTDRITISPAPGVIAADPSRRAIGIATDAIGIVRLPFFRAVAEGFNETVAGAVAVVAGIGSLIGGAFTFSGSLSGVAGPVGIASLTGSAAALGLGAVLSFAALISINLGVLNLFPFPALDGGRLALLAIESVARRKVPSRFANAINMLGFALLAILMLAVTAHDIFRLVG